MTAFLTAIQTFVQQQHQDTLQAVYSWILGSLDTAGWHDVVLLLPYAGLSAVVLLVGWGVNRLERWLLRWKA